MPRSLLTAVAAGVLSAVMFVSTVYLPLIGFAVGQVSPAPLMAAAFALGSTAALVGGVAGMVALLLAGPWPLAAAYGVSDVLPAVLVARLALRSRMGPDGDTEWYPPGRLLGWLTVGAVALLAAAAVAAGVWGPGLQAVVRDGLTAVLASVAADVPEATRAEVAETWMPVLPGGVLASWLFRAIVSGMLAQWAVARAGRALRPTPRYVETVLPVWFLPLLAGCLAAGWLLPGEVGWLTRNAALVVSAAYLAQGLTVIHAAARLTRHPRGWLTAFYVLFLFASGVAVVAIIGLGLVDHVTRLRTRFRGASRQEEE